MPKKLTQFLIWSPMCVKFVYRVLNEQWSSFTVRSCTNVRVHTEKSCWKSFSSLAASLSSFEAGLVMLNHASPYTQVALLRWWWWCLHQIGAVCKIYVVFGIVSDMFITNINEDLCLYSLDKTMFVCSLWFLHHIPLMFYVKSKSASIFIVVLAE